MKKLREKLSAFVLMSHFYRVRGSVFYSPFSSPFPSKESTNKNEYFLQFIMPKQHPCRFSAPGITGGKNRYFFFKPLLFYLRRQCSHYTLRMSDCCQQLEVKHPLTLPSPCPERISVQQQQSHVVHCKKHSWEGPFCLLFLRSAHWLLGWGTVDWFCTPRVWWVDTEKEN